MDVVSGRLAGVLIAALPPCMSGNFWEFRVGLRDKRLKGLYDVVYLTGSSGGIPGCVKDVYLLYCSRLERLPWEGRQLPLSHAMLDAVLDLPSSLAPHLCRSVLAIWTVRGSPTIGHRLWPRGCVGIDDIGQLTPRLC